MTEVRFPREPAQAIWGERRAGGTDVMDRLHHGRVAGPIVDLRDVPGLDTVAATTGGGLRLGAALRLTAVAAAARVEAGWPGFAEATGGLATPQLRTMATLGGNLLQRTRCAWYRSPDFRCFKAGGQGCPAAAVDHPWNAPLATGPCVAPHPSTVGLALLAFDAEVELTPRGRVSLAALYGDGQAPDREHTVTDEELLVAVILPAPRPGARSGWFRVASRARAERPLVEVVVHVAPGFARVAAGGLAPVPVRLPTVEAALIQGTSVAEAVAALPVPAGAAASTRTKLPQLARAVEIVLVRRGGVPSSPAGAPAPVPAGRR
jgi:xanthine dehydrogenase YagS FAD-binding subunit